MAKNIIFAIHGLGGQSGWFQRLKDEIEKYNIDFFSIDLPGFGMNHSKANPSNPFRIGHIDSYQEWITYCQKQYINLKHKNPDSRVIILGHSLGAVIACQLDIAEGDKLVLSVPGFKGAKSTFDPMFTLLTLAKVIIGKWIFGKDIYITMPVSEKAIDSPAMKDPLRVAVVTQTLLFEILKMHKACRKKILNIKCPVLLIQVEDDKVVDNASQDLIFGQIASSQKNKKVYGGVDHDWIWYEINALVAQDIANWCNK